MTAPTDSFAAIVAELRATIIRSAPIESSDCQLWADRIERLDSEMRKDSDLVQYMLLCESVDDDAGDRADTIWDELDAYRQDLARTFSLGLSHKEVQQANIELRARLAACEPLIAEAAKPNGPLGIAELAFHLHEEDDGSIAEPLESLRKRCAALATRASVPKDAATGAEGKDGVG